MQEVVALQVGGVMGDMGQWCLPRQLGSPFQASSCKPALPVQVAALVLFMHLPGTRDAARSTALAVLQCVLAS